MESRQQTGIESENFQLVVALVESELEGPEIVLEIAVLEVMTTRSSE